MQGNRTIPPSTRMGSRQGAVPAHAVGRARTHTFGLGPIHAGCGRHTKEGIASPASLQSSLALHGMNRAAHAPDSHAYRTLGHSVLVRQRALQTPSVHVAFAWHTAASLAAVAEQSITHTPSVVVASAEIRRQV
jgi:hypothetical protein